MCSIRLVAVVLFTGMMSPAQTGTDTAKVTVETEVVYIGRGGFFPSHITRPPGKFRLLVLNHSGLRSLKPHLVDAPGTSLVQFSTDPLESPYQPLNDVDVKPGTYHLSPQRKCPFPMGPDHRNPTMTRSPKNA